MTHNIKLSILVQVQVACALYKIAQVCNLLVCDELFIVDWWIVSFVFKEAITIINIAFKIKFIVWSSKMLDGHGDAPSFKTFCGFLSI